jgi:hypothetical protein
MKKLIHTTLLLASGLAGSATSQDSVRTEAREPVWLDYDADGLEDLYAHGRESADVLLRNLGDGRFDDVTREAGLANRRSRRALSVDLDGDGRAELLLVGFEGGLTLYQGVEGGGFQERGGLADVAGIREAESKDFVRDERVDLWLETEAGALLLRNVGELTFERVALGLEAVEIPAAVVAPSPEPSSAEEPPPASSGATTRGATGRRPVPAAVSLSGIEETGVPPWSRPRITSLDLIGSFTNCPQSINDQAGAGCLQASSEPTPGMLYPLSENLFVDSAGRVGIGTTTPSADFHVTGATSRIEGQLTADNLFLLGEVQSDIRFDSPIASVRFPDVSGSTNPMITMFETTNNVDRMVIGHSPSFENWGLQYDDSTDTFIFQQTPSLPVLSVGLISQAVGIGTRTPTEDLHIVRPNTDASVTIESNVNVTLLLEADTNNSGGEDQQPELLFSQDGGLVQSRIGMFDSENDLRFEHLWGEGNMQFWLPGREETTDPAGDWEWVSARTPAFLGFPTGGPNVRMRLRQSGSLEIDGFYTTPAADVAEIYRIRGPLEPGDVVVFAGDGQTLTRARAGDDTRLAGVISTRPGLLLGLSYSVESETGTPPGARAALADAPSDSAERAARFDVAHEIEVNGRAPLALSGRVPVKVTAANGAIQAGDLLTISSLPGHAMRATESGPVLGTALESWSQGQGEILVFANLGWYTPGNPSREIAELRAELQSMREALAEVLDR